MKKAVFSLVGVLMLVLAFTLVYDVKVAQAEDPYKYSIYIANTLGIKTGATLDVDGSADFGAGITVSGESAVGGLDFTGTYTGNVIDLGNNTIDHTGSNGPCLIRAGTYASPVTHADEDQSGFIRMYGNTTANGSSYDRGIFVALQTHGTKGIFPIAGLAEIHEQSGAGPGSAQAGQFIAMLQTSTSKLAAGTAFWGTMNGIWAKIGGVSGSTTANGSTISPIWVDNQMTTTISGLEYGLYSTTGASRPDAWAGFYTSSSGYDQLFRFDATYNSGAGTMVTTDAVPGGNQDARIKVYYNGTQYYIPLYR